MKKLLLLLAAGSFVTAANAQDNQSVMFTHAAPVLPTLNSTKHVSFPKRAQSASGELNKTTGAQSAWFSFQDANTSANTVLTPFPIYNDTTLYVPNGTPTPFNWYLNGLGTSFDPTSTVFTPLGFQNSQSMYPMPTFGVGSQNTYTVDSVTVWGFDDRKSYNKYVDTLYIYLAATPAAGTWLPGYSFNSFFVDTFHIPNGIFHVATMQYDSATNSILTSKVPSVIKLTKILDSAAFNDSIINADGTGGGHIFTLSIPNGGLVVPPGGKVVAYQQFVSGHKYRNDVSIDSANTWDVVSAAMNGTSQLPTQLNNDYNAGLVMTGQSRYWMNSQQFANGATQYIISSYFYVTAGFQDPFFAFHINCTGCFNVGVNNVSKTISNANAYPNPATDEVIVPFTLSQSSSASVTLINTIGQVINTQNFTNVTSGKASFNTSSLAGGVYFYTVEANGERTTGRFVVAH